MPSSRTKSPRGAATSRTAPGSQVVVQVAAGDAVGLLLDADPVGAGVRRRGQRVAAHRGGLPGAGDPQRQVLAGPRGRERRAVGRGEVDRGHRRRFPGRLLATRSCRKAGQAGPASRGGASAVPSTLGSGQQVAERALPAGAEGGDLQGGAQLVLVPAGQVEQRVGVGHRQRVRAGPRLDDRIAGLDVSLGDDPHVKAGTVVADQQRGQFRLA